MEFFLAMGYYKSMMCLLDDLPNEGKPIPVMNPDHIIAFYKKNGRRLMFQFWILWTISRCTWMDQKWLVKDCGMASRMKKDAIAPSPPFRLASDSIRNSISLATLVLIRAILIQTPTAGKHLVTPRMSKTTWHTLTTWMGNRPRM